MMVNTPTGFFSAQGEWVVDSRGPTIDSWMRSANMGVEELSNFTLYRYNSIQSNILSNIVN